MASVLSSFFSRDPRSSFPYDIPADSFTSYRGVLMGNSYKKAEPNEKATCFWSNDSSSILKVQAQKLKTLRHPNVLAYLEYIEVNDGTYLITESCEPLEYYFNRVKLSPAQKELFVSWGLYQILTCLKFLHNEVKISQNNLKESIYVTSSGDWKLSGFQNTAPYSGSGADLNDLAVVIFQIFNGFSATVNLKSILKIPKRCQALYKKLASSSKNISAEDLLTEGRSSGGFMRNKFVDTLLFLDEFQLKDSGDKQSFFMNLKDNLDMFPDDVAKRKILPKLIHTYEYGDAGSYILVPMFKLGQLLDEDEYQYRIVPCLVKLFSSSDRNTRVKLLEKIDEFAPHLRPEVVNESIYGNLITGFSDTNPAVRESTVKAMVAIADKLNYHNLNNDLMKYLARLQGGDDQPGIRTNTTICLGKIGCYIDPSHRQRILISAFTRALKDPFPPARMAGVLALSATQQYYSLKEVASKILPSLAPLTMDPEKQVRDQGFKALKGFLENLEKASENPEIIPELEANVKAGGRSGLLSGDKVPQWAGWALKAISGKFYKHTAPPTTDRKVASVKDSVSENVTGKLESVITISTTNTDLKEVNDAPGGDGWDDMDDDFGDDFGADVLEDNKEKLSKSEHLASKAFEGNSRSTIESTKPNKTNAFETDLIDLMSLNELDEFSEKPPTEKFKRPSAEPTGDGWDAEFTDFAEIKKSTAKPKEVISVSTTTSTRTQQKLPKPAGKTGGPLKLGAKKISSKSANPALPADFERDLLG